MFGPLNVKLNYVEIVYQIPRFDHAMKAKTIDFYSLCHVFILNKNVVSQTCI